MKRMLPLFAAAAAAAAAAMEPDGSDPALAALGEMRITSDYFLAQRTSSAAVATGKVEAVAGPVRFCSNRVERDGAGNHDFGNATLTTCTNEACAAHWRISGRMRHRNGRSVDVENARLELFGVPVAWAPYWYYPLNTDYGVRVIPGYTSKWGGYLLTGYVYDIVGESGDGGWGLGGSTYADLRTKNGLALGQTVRWRLGALGKGKLRMYHAWDENSERYSNHMHDRKHNWANWGSPVGYNRYALSLVHSADLSERDIARVRATWVSDSHFIGDFFERYERMSSVPVNEAWYEHRESSWAAGVSVSGPLNNFYGGVSRLPEFWIEAEPQPIWELPLVYESRTRAGMLNRDDAKYEKAEREYARQPGSWADYQAFRIDSIHRVTLPFRALDILSVVPRAGCRGTWYSDGGRAGDISRASGDGIWRGIAEAGVRLSARGRKWYGEYLHTLEPYCDYSYQDVDISRNGRSGRIYYFDSIDRSYGWLDQFGFDGRELPVKWHGLRPGVRNIVQLRDESGVLRDFADIDIYAAIPFERTKTGEDGRPRSDRYSPYNRSGERQFVPGVMARLRPSRGTSLGVRAEYDGQNDTLAYSQIDWRHKLDERFSWYFSYIGRDHRLWDYADAQINGWNRSLTGIAELGFTHELCDAFGYSPFCRWDCRRNELDEIGTWVELRTDCLAFRLTASFEDSFRRIDGSKRSSDLRVGFFVYLRAFGSRAMADFGRF